MLYVTTYYDNVKPRRRVRRLPTAGRGGGHPQAASSDWRAILVDGHGRMVGETRPRGPVGSICPATKNAPPCGGAERLRNIACPEKLPRTANRLLRSPRRQTKLSSRKPPSSRKALLQRAARPNFFPSQGNTLSQTLLAFGAECQLRRCLTTAPIGLRSYRRIGQTLLASLPRLNFGHHGATRMPIPVGSHVRLPLLRNTAPLSPQFR